VDVVLLEQLWEKIQKETEISAKRELLEKACKLYEGEFFLRFPVKCGWKI